MKNMIIEQTDATPYIELDINESNLIFKGKSFPENTFEFYSPILKTLEDYFRAKVSVNVEVELEYLNSSSLKVFFDIFDIFEESCLSYGSTVVVNWMYHKENDIAEETGEDFKDDFKSIEINVQEKS